VDWDGHAEREEERYADGLARLPADPDARQKQLVRVAMAATGAGLARLMQGRRAEAAGWLSRSAERFRESYAGAPPGSWGRLLGAVKARVLGGDHEGAAADAAWALEQEPAASESPIGRYAAVLALLVLERDGDALPLADGLCRVTMHRPDNPGYHLPETWVLGDWRMLIRLSRSTKPGHREPNSAEGDAVGI
jgi:hypothetical protein